GDYTQGSSVPITAIPTEGWMFTGWSGEGITDPSSPETTVTLDSAKTVTANFVPADPYPAWAESMGLTGEEADPDADPDGDGLSNRAEMLLGFHPNDPNSRLELSIVSVGTDSLRLRINRAVTTGTFVLRSSSDLSGNWTETPVAIPADTEDFEFEIPRSGGRSFHQLVYRTP